MTNEEKARECARGWHGDVYDCAEEAALEMAKWKDRQFRQILRKRWKESQNNPDDKQLKIALFDEIMDIFLGED